MKTPLTLAFCISCLVDLSAASPALPAQNTAGVKVYFSHCQCFELPVCYVEPNRDVPIVTKDAVFADDENNGKQALQDWEFVLLHGDEFPGR